VQVNVCTESINNLAADEKFLTIMK